MVFGSINRLNLKINDLNKEAEYQDCKHKIENVWIKRLLLWLTMMGLIETGIGVILWLTVGLDNLNFLFNVGLAVVTFILFKAMPKVSTYMP